MCLPISQQQSQAARSPKISDLHTNNILQGMLLCGDIVQKTAVKTAHLEAYWLHAMHWNWKKKKKRFSSQTAILVGIITSDTGELQQVEYPSVGLIPCSFYIIL